MGLDNLRMKRRRVLNLLGTVGAINVAGCVTGQSAPDSSRTSSDRESSTPTTDTTLTQDQAEPIYVAPEDGDSGGRGTRNDPFHTISKGFEVAEPGETIVAMPGRYTQGAETVRPGEPENPITLTGPPEAVFVGGNSPSGWPGLAIRHSHIHLTGLTFDGLQDAENRASVESYSPWNIVIVPYRPPKANAGRPRTITDVTITPHGVGNVLGNCIHLFHCESIEIGEFEVIGPAGIKHLHGDVQGHHGEIIYIGTPPGRWDKLWNGYPDRPRNIHIHHIQNSTGFQHTELVDAKAGSSNVLIEYCTDTGGSGAYKLHEDKPPSDEAAFGLRGANLTLRWCVIENGHGAGVHIGNASFRKDDGKPDTHVDLDRFDLDYLPGTENSVYGNRILDNTGLAVAFQSIRHDADFDNGPGVQEVICGNTVNGETMGDPTKSCPESIPAGDGIGHLGGESPW